MNSIRAFGRGLREIFMDVDDGYSAKRVGFFIFIILIAVLTIASVFGNVQVLPMIFNGLVDLVKWIGAAILGERAPAALAAMRGNPAPSTTSTSTSTHTSTPAPPVPEKATVK